MKLTYEKIRELKHYALAWPTGIEIPLARVELIALIALAERALLPQPQEGQALPLWKAEKSHDLARAYDENGDEIAGGYAKEVFAFVEAHNASMRAYASRLALPAGPVPEDALHGGPEIVTDPVELRMLAQHRRLKARKRRTGEATADFDLPAPNDDASPAVAQPVADEYEQDCERDGDEHR